MTNIEWTDATWNPVTGCTKVSAGCKNCYAEGVAERFWATQYRPVLAHNGKTIDSISTSHHEDYLRDGLARPRRFTDVQTHPDRLDEPLRWRKPRRVFVNSMSDLFHDAVSDEFIDRVFAAMALAPRHTFQVLTKRPQRMRDYMRRLAKSPGCADQISEAARLMGRSIVFLSWPLPHVWLGVSCEDQTAADERIPLLLETPAAVRFLSCEPLLGPIDLRMANADEDGVPCDACIDEGKVLGIDWVITGGESGPGARPCDVAWIRSIVEQCNAERVACFVKQLGGYAILDPRYDRSIPGWTRKLRDPKGGDPEEWPEALRVREFPEAR